jgi:endoglucanase
MGNSSDFLARMGFLLFLSLSSILPASSQDHYRVEGTRIAAPAGMPEMNRGIGLGGWLVPEGYMLHTPGHWGPQQINEAIVDLIGGDAAATFWELYRAHHVAEKDIAAIADWGFDHVRLPMHWNLLYDAWDGSFLESGFATIDSLVTWSERHDLGVILDMHAAPGAQSDGPIADSDGEARLWTEPDPYQDFLVEIWAEIARRYADSTTIIGYDLLNEPVTPDTVEDPGQTLRALYERVTDAIRTHDPHHIVFIEGNYFATTFDHLTPPFDDNMVYTFHKYWNPPDLGTIWYLLNIRDEWQRPLWLGETGENSNVWYFQTMRLAEEHGIPWNFWTHKKIRTTTAPLSSPITAGYQRVLDYWHDRGPRPSADDARTSLFTQARALDLDSARVNIGVLPSLMNASWEVDRQPTAENRIPGSINAVDYDLGNQGVTYFDSDYWAVSGAPGGGNSGTHLRNDGVDIETSLDTQGHAYNVGWLAPLEWMEYTVNVEQSGTYRIDTRLASPEGGGTLNLYMNGQSIGQVTAQATGGWQLWQTHTLTDVPLTAGSQILRLTVGRTAGFNINQLTFSLTEPTRVDLPSGTTRREPDLFPLPASDRVTIQFHEASEAPLRLIVSDILGREVLQSTIEAGSDGVTKLPVGELPAGLYFIRAMTMSAGGGSGDVVLTRLLPILR